MEENKKSKRPLVSIIVPAFKQEKTIAKDIRRIEDVLSKIGKSSEVIVVVDGKIDKTFEEASKLRSATTQVIGYVKNRGKGYAVRFGMKFAKGDIIGFIDAGMDIHPSGLSILLGEMDWYDADIVIGSKRHPASKINYPFNRRVISYLSQILIRFLFGLNVSDTQVGMKFFKRKVLETVMPRLLVKQYAFDIEVLVVASNLGFKKIYEAPIKLKWTMGSGITTTNLWRVLLLTLWDTLAIFYRLKLRHYYSDKNRKNWKLDPELKFIKRLQ